MALLCCCHLLHTSQQFSGWFPLPHRVITESLTNHNVLAALPGRTSSMTSGKSHWSLEFISIVFTSSNDWPSKMQFSFKYSNIPSVNLNSTPSTILLLYPSLFHLSKVPPHTPLLLLTFPSLSYYLCKLTSSTLHLTSLGPGFEPHQCLLAGMWKRSAQLPCWLSRGRQVSQQRWTHMPLQAQIRLPTVTLKPRGNVIRSSKQMYQWQHKRDLMSSKKDFMLWEKI